MVEFSTRIPASPSKVQGVSTVDAKVNNGAAGGKRSNVGSESVFGWTSWGRRFSHQIHMGKEHSGEVHMTVGSRGCMVSWPFLVTKHLYFLAVVSRSDHRDIAITTCFTV